MDVDEYTKVFSRKIEDIISKFSLNQRDFREIIEIAEQAIRELDEIQAEWRAEQELDQMQYEQAKTRSWIVKHPARVLREGQVEIIRSVPTFDQAVSEASKFHSMVNERYNRSRVTHDSTKDFFTILEMPEDATEADVRQAFMKQEGFTKLLHLNDLFR